MARGPSSGLSRWLLISALLGGGPAAAQTETYDPLAITQGAELETLELTVDDEERERELPLRVYLPATAAPAPVVLFSHGLGGSREGSAFLGRHWAARGYVAVFLQHPGSDVSVWEDEPVGERLAALKEAASLQNFLLRVQDVPAVLDRLERWNGEEEHALVGRLDLGNIGMAGHSFGAVTTQAVCGQEFGRGSGQGSGRAGLSFTDARIKAALVLSPSSPGRGRDPVPAFAKVSLPWMLMTGTRDVAPIGDASVESRLAVYPALPAGGKYELVLHGAEHSVFTERSLPGETGERNPNHHRAVLALSTAFFDAWLRGDAEARAWLDGDGPRSVLEEEDRWQRK